MTHVPSGTELARPFVPAKDLELSKRFYVPNTRARLAWPTSLRA